jgi:hypothetical protein
MSEFNNIEFIPFITRTPTSNDSTPISTPSSTPPPQKRKIEKIIVFNDEVMERLTKDKTPATILTKNSNCTDDEVLLAILLKYNLVLYECSSSNCTVKSTWRRKPIKLIIYRKNSKAQDLRLDNLELLCPNCYCQQYGSTQLLKQVINQRIIKCRICGYDKVHMLGDIYRTLGYCQICYKKIQSSQASTNSIVKTDLLLYKSIESANTGFDVEISNDITQSLTNNIRELIPGSSSDIMEYAAFMGSSSSDSKSMKAKVRKPRTPKKILDVNADNVVIIKCIDDIDTNDLMI